MADVCAAIKNVTLTLTHGDITRQEVDAIVNAANSNLMGGGGVDGAIHRAGGPQILEECKQIRSLQGQCAPGSAVITSGGKLKARHVIHAVGPIWRGGKTNESATLAHAYRSCLALADDYQLKSIAFPSISTGAYGYPVEKASQTALTVVVEHLKGATTLTDVRFVLFDQFAFNAYKESLQAILATAR